MEVVKSATEVSLSLINKLETTVSKFYQRKDLTEDNKVQLGRVQRDSARLRKLIQQIEPRLTHDVVSKATLDRHRETLQEDIDQLTSWEQKIQKAKPQKRVRRMKQVLDKCEKDVNDFFELLNNTASSNSQQPEMLRGYIMGRNTVPPNPSRLVLDYTTTATCEGELRAAILEPKQRRMVGLIASGKGGVGKTCALRGLADDSEIKNNFPGGTLYIQLGNDATLRGIITGIAQIVEGTGGFELAEKIRTTENVQEASRRASVWFCKQTCLFSVDDIWKVNGIDSDVLTILGSMVNETSLLVYTTRDRHFLNRAHKVIKFEEKETQGDLARRMLMKHGGFREEEVLVEDENRVAFEAILDECQGLPLAFGIAGGAVWKKSELKPADQKQDAWSDVHQQMISKQGTSTLLEEPAEPYGWLTRIVDVSLEVLEERYWKLFRALCVLQKQQSAPLSMLQRLWNLENPQEAENVARALNDVSVVQLTDRDSILSVQLHDLILDIAKDKASKEETRSFFQTLVRNYAQSGQVNDGCTPAENCADEIAPGNNEVVSQTTNLEKKSFEQSRAQAWWNIENDGYLHNNLCRALRCAGHTDELLWLLSQPQWIVHRLLNGGVNRVEQDLEEGKSVLSNTTSHELRHREHLDIIGKAARLGCVYVQNNEVEVWFQLHGRLLRHATENKRTKEFVKRIECCAPRPWVKASLGILQQAGGGADETIPAKGKVLCTQREQDDLWFIWKGERGMGVSRYNIPSGRNESVDCTGAESYADIRCAAFLHGQGCIASAHADGRIILWSRETGEMKQDVVCKRNPTHSSGRRRWTECFGICASGTEGVVPDDEPGRFVAFSADGTRVASTGRNHTIRVWDAHSGAAVGEPLRGHIEKVRCVAVSADGRRIVSGSDDKTVRVWDAHSGRPIGAPLPHDDWVTDVRVDADCSHIVSRERHGPERLWDAQRGECVLTSDDASWRSAVDALTLSASVGEDWWYSRSVAQRVETRSGDGSRLVLATCEGGVINLGGGEVYWSRTLDSCCRIVR